MLRPSRSKLRKRRPLKKSPLKDNPLRNPGQSLDETIQTLMDEDTSAAIAVMMFCIVLTGYEWWRWYAQIPYHPWIMTLLCSGTILYCIFRLYTFKQQIKTLRLARDGEKAVGQYLESLRETGHCVFHDVIGNHFNLDHVIVGPQRHFHHRNQNLQ
ncbi:MAG: nuclease-related domain-containing protein [Cyanobacteria bacterium J06553_1]